ncbi:MAG: peptidyl-prolyl cis-trans isomerase, partial [Helicobacter sp.]|nr:peptidyl-prolyl cis-trans isomerase [Helicobacter sp.]
AKAQIREDYQKSEAEKQALRRYIEYKKQSESYTGEHITLSSEQIAQKFGQELLNSLLELKAAEALKPILTESGFVTLKLQNIEQSKALDFESAKEQAASDLLRQKHENLLRQNADSRIENFVGADIGFVARDDIGKLSMLGAEDAAAFLEQLFAKTKAKDYMILAQKAILYRISAQELFAFENLAANKDFLENNVVQLKDRIIESAFMNYLQKRYIVIRADAELGNR